MADIKQMNLALQGGGAHGAFTWGVLDRLLDEKNVEIEGISGTSAGAVNATLLAHGLMADGRRGAQKSLAEFWEKTSRAGSVWSPLPTSAAFPVPGFSIRSPSFFW